MTMTGDGPMLISLADYERAAEEVLELGAHAYYAGGATDELTLRDNIDAWQRIALMPRVLVGAAERDPSVSILGRRRPHPLIVAPMAFQRLAHEDGELAVARASAAAGATITVSTYSTATLPGIAEAAPDGSRWFQLYVDRDRGFTRDLVAQAVEQGYEALVITVDLPVVGVRERELRWPVEVEEIPALIQHARGSRGEDPATPMEIASGTDPGLNWADIERFAADTPIPVIVKGVLAPEDAVLAAEHGARAVIVSNHGGRQLDTVIASAEALAAVVEAAAGRIDVLVDGGIRRGTDVFQALALGACGVLVGRPILWGLAAGGEPGARRVIEILLEEFDATLALTGAIRADDINARFLAPGYRVGPTT
jgi:isopentenyl diphosphate isomerase/L-lactate dehydrogenase-like FMN-dependent dehydrogenase